MGGGVNRSASVSPTVTSVEPPPARRSASSIFPACGVVLGGGGEEVSDAKARLLPQPVVSVPGSEIDRSDQNGRGPSWPTTSESCHLRLWRTKDDVQGTSGTSVLERTGHCARVRAAFVSE